MRFSLTHLTEQEPEALSRPNWPEVTQAVSGRIGTGIRDLKGLHSSTFSSLWYGCLFYISHLSVRIGIHLLLQSICFSVSVGRTPLTPCPHVVWGRLLSLHLWRDWGPKGWSLFPQLRELDWDMASEHFWVTGPENFFVPTSLAHGSS